MSVQLPFSQVVVVSGGEDHQELSKPKVRVRSDITEKSTKMSGRQSQAKILGSIGFPADDKEVRTTYTDVFFYIYYLLYILFHDTIQIKYFPTTVKSICLSLE